MLADHALEASAPMFEMTFRAEGNCLIAEVTGWIDGVEAVIAVFMRIAAELQTIRCNHLLILDRTRGVVPSEQEMQKLMAALEGSGFDDMRVAYVDVRGTAVSRMEVAEILGRERGYDCRVFDNEQRARIWLNYGDD
jgi:hypothetical protein